MKNWKVLVFVLVFGIAFFGCNGNESAEISSNNEQRLIGTWICINDGSTWVFNSDGTMSHPNDIPNYSIRFVQYTAIGDKIILIEEEYGLGYECDFRLSSDGKTMIIIVNGLRLYYGGATAYGLSFRKNN